MGKTTTEEDQQVEQGYWQNYFLINELKEEIFPNAFYVQNPLRNFLSLVDLERHEAEDNIRSDSQLELLWLSSASWSSWEAASQRRD